MRQLKKHTHYRVYNNEIIRIRLNTFNKDFNTDTGEVIDAPEGCKYFKKIKDAEEELLKQQKRIKKRSKK